MKLKAVSWKRWTKIVKSLARLIKKKRERTQINKIKNEKGEVTTNTAENTKDHKTTTSSFMTVWQYNTIQYNTKMDYLEEMDRFLGTIFQHWVRKR